MRYACAVEYDGRGFSGWQRQANARSVQADLEAALSQVANHPVEIACAGRTDAGVHATWQIVHFDSRASRTLRSWLLGVNANLPDDVRVLSVMSVADDFHARFSAQTRRYRYVILERRVRSALLRHRVAWTHRRLDERLMREGAVQLIGEHDFSAFRALACQAKSPRRTIHVLDVQRRGEYLYLDVEANGFLHHMVRNIAGVLMEVGRGERSPEWTGELLQARDRSRGGVTAPAAGLYLVGVRYPEDHGIAPLGAVPVFA
jgi:tRNA pseudouridine38-40 synthase